ncbi:MAG: NAD(P)H-dependent oxidoreductase [Sphingomonas sp.]
MKRRIALIDGHPDADRARFVHALADRYAEGARGGGGEVRRIDLATLDFPLLRSRGQWEGAPPAMIAEAQKTIAWADHIVLLYPLWLGDVPALLKAFLEQTLRPGFAFDKGKGPFAGLLRGKSARIVVTMGMPALFYRFYYGAHSVASLRLNVLGLVGVGPVRRTLIGGVESSAAGRGRWLKTMAELGRKAR